MPNPKTDRYWEGGKRSKPPPLREYLRRLHRVVLDQFLAAPFSLDKPTAEKCANEVMKVIARNHKRARSSGFI